LWGSGPELVKVGSSHSIDISIKIQRKSKQLLREDSANKRFIVYIPIRTDLYTFKQLIYFLISHLLAKLCEDVAKFTSSDEPVSFLVEYLEAPDELFRCTCWFEPVWAVQDR